MEAASRDVLAGPGGVTGPEAAVRACCERIRPLAEEPRNHSRSLATALDFARDVEDLSRLVEQLQIVAAAAVEETWACEPDRGSGHRNAADCLRGALRIGVSEARRRLVLSGDVLASCSLAGEPTTPSHPELATALADGAVASRTATGICPALESVRYAASPEARQAMEECLVSAARLHDPDFVRVLARRWVEGLNQDGEQPGEEELARRQGAFVRKPVRGLQHLEIFATQDQFEQLLTVMNAWTNPRLTNPRRGGGAAAGQEPEEPWGPASESVADRAVFADRRSRARKLLDGLVGACGMALSSGRPPRNGGLRPQVMVTIPYDQLFTDLREKSLREKTEGLRSGTFVFSGPVNARTVRKVACDADLIPVVLGGEGQILDIGRASRVFPPHVRKALIARDQGCAFPGCTLPAPWCEAHHVDYWSRGGDTGAGNGVLLCSHHHHVIHQEEWQVRMRSGVPWFVPPPHLDPRRRPRRNHFFRPPDVTVQAGLDPAAQAAQSSQPTAAA